MIRKSGIRFSTRQTPKEFAREIMLKQRHKIMIGLSDHDLMRPAADPMAAGLTSMGNAKSGD